MTSRMGRSLLRAALAVVLLAAALAASWSQVDDSPPLPAALPAAQPAALPDLPLPPSPTAEAEPEAAPQRPAQPRGEPAQVVIPAIDVDVDLVRLALAADGSMQVPDFGLAGWYTEGPRPGHPGPAVIAAHVDSRSGPDVFYRLGDLAAGDEVHVVYDSGDRVTFIVDSSDQTPKDDLPVDAIWPTTNERLLTLVTCGGEFDPRSRHYRDNVIVYTSM